MACYDCGYLYALDTRSKSEAAVGAAQLVLQGKSVISHCDIVGGVVTMTNPYAIVNNKLTGTRFGFIADVGKPPKLIDPYSVSRNLFVEEPC